MSSKVRLHQRIRHLETQLNTSSVEMHRQAKLKEDAFKTLDRERLDVGDGTVPFIFGIMVGCAVTLLVQWLL